MQDKKIDKQYKSIEKLALALNNVASKYKGEDPKFAAIELQNTLANYNLSDRETEGKYRSGIRDNFQDIIELLKLFSIRLNGA